jgi:hypothetical protein
MVGREAPVLLGLLIACHGGEPVDSDTDPAGGCGDVTTWDITIRAAVIDGDSQAPVEGADVTLYDEAWNPGDTLGTAQTGADGHVELVATDVTSVDGCWGTALDYELIAMTFDKSGVMELNSALHAAIDDGTLVVDVTAFPIELVIQPD